MLNLLPQSRTKLLCAGFCLALLISADVHACPEADAIEETKVSQDQLIVYLNTPFIQRELELSNEQVAQIAAINKAPFAVTFSEAMAPLNTILTDKQLKEFKRTALPGLMVRAFLVSEVREALELTPEQMSSIAAIQAKLRTQLQRFQDKINQGGSPKNIAEEIQLERNTATFHEDAYVEALELLTIEQRKKWEEIAKPLPISPARAGSGC
jgi:hypothetical protein